MPGKWVLEARGVRVAVQPPLRATVTNAVNLGADALSLLLANWPPAILG